MRTTSRCIALVVAILSSGLPIMAQAQKKADATRILNNMFRVYSRLASYQDEGILVTTNDEATGGTIEKMPFKTFFKRPNLFRFEWTDFGITKLGRTKLMWFNGKEAFTYWEPDIYEKEESLRLALNKFFASFKLNSIIKPIAAAAYLHMPVYSANNRDRSSAR